MGDPAMDPATMKMKTTRMMDPDPATRMRTRMKTMRTMDPDPATRMRMKMKIMRTMDPDPATRMRTRKMMKTKKFVRTPRSSRLMARKRTAGNSLLIRSRKRERRRLAKNLGNFVARGVDNANKPAGSKPLLAMKKASPERNFPCKSSFVVVKEEMQTLS